jgi:hypothetical protein
MIGGKTFLPVKNRKTFIDEDLIAVAFFFAPPFSPFQETDSYDVRTHAKSPAL